MHLIFCVDDRDGLSFCGRRLSRDRKLNEHMLRLAAGGKLWMSPYSVRLFGDGPVFADPDFLQKANAGDYCFVEQLPLPDHCLQPESIVLYCWNRTYPATTRFPRSLLANLHLVQTEEFPGNSHEKITMERYAL